MRLIWHCLRNCSPAPSITAGENEELWIDLENRFTINWSSFLMWNIMKKIPAISSWNTAKCHRKCWSNELRNSKKPLSKKCMTSLTNFWRLLRHQCLWRGKFWSAGIQNSISRNARILKWVICLSHRTLRNIHRPRECSTVARPCNEL